MALDDIYDDDDSFHDAPPRESLLPEIPDDADTGTIQSLEFGRRAFSEDPRLGRISVGRLSSQFAEMNDLDAVEEEFEIDGPFISRRPTLDPTQLLAQLDEEDVDNTTTEIRALTGRRDGRRSDVDLGVFGEDDEPGEPTFQFVIPDRFRAPIRQESPIEEDSPRSREEDGAETVPGVRSDAATGNDQDREEGADAVPLEQPDWESEREGDDVDLRAYREEASAIDRSLLTEASERPIAQQSRNRKQSREIKLSRFGKEYTSLPAATVKTLANTFAKSAGSKSKISKDTLDALIQTSDWYLEQVGIDLAAYAQHAGRNMIEEEDVVALMKRYVTVIQRTAMYTIKIQY
jgi:histone H3/H4